MVLLGTQLILASLVGRLSFADVDPVQTRVPQYILLDQKLKLDGHGRAADVPSLTAELIQLATPLGRLGYFEWLWPPDMFDHDEGLTIHLDERTNLYLKFASLDSAKIMRDLLIYGDISYVLAYDEITTRRSGDHVSHYLAARDAYVWIETARRFVPLRKVIAPLRSSEDQTWWDQFLLHLSGRALEI